MRFSNSILFPVLLFALISVGCSTHRPLPTPAPHRTVAVETNQTPRETKPPDAVAPPKKEDEIEISETPAVSTSNETAPLPLKLILPSNQRFLSTPLPATAPTRYRRWKNRGVIRSGQSHLQNLEVVDNGRKVLVLSPQDNIVRVYERSSMDLLFSYPIPNIDTFDPVVLAPWPDVDPSPRYLLAKKDGVWRCDLNGDMSLLYDGTAFQSLRWSPDGTILAAAASDIHTQTSELYFFHRGLPLHLDLLGRIELTERVDGWDLSRDNRYLVVIYYPSDTMALIDLHTGETLWQIPTPEFGGDVSFSPNGKAAAMGGSALLLVNVIDPARRVTYDAFDNNIGQVRFSPSGDALVTSSYDGKIRIFDYDESAPRLALLKTLSHGGSANVYDIRFLDNGRALASASGDQTVRFWGSRKPVADDDRPGEMWQPLKPPPPAPEEHVSPVNLRSMTEEERRAMLTELINTPRHRPSMLDAPPRPSGIAPGRYACKVSKEYKFRECEVKVLPSGHTVLEIEKGNLIAARGVLYDDGKVVRFEGGLTDEKPFKCFSCSDRCYVNPESCHCVPGDIERTRSCLGQPIHAVFRGKGRKWRGVILYHDYYDKQLPPTLPPADFEVKGDNNRFIVELRKK